MEVSENIHSFGLPDDITQYIIASLPVWDVCSLASCSRHWRSACSSNIVWFILYKKRWSLGKSSYARLSRSHLWGGAALERRWDGRMRNSTLIGGTFSQFVCFRTFMDWRSEYICLHKRMLIGATSVIDFIKGRACHDSMEVADYQKAMNLLSSTGLELQDVVTFLLLPKLSVLVNLLGLHYCLLHLKMKGNDAREVLSMNKIGERQVCLRWWSLGGWTNGFRRHDEMHMQIASLLTLAELEAPSFLEVIDRGTRHEVLRVQISADFESSAWVARSMHSQR
ncbi:hypothetical protein KP509_17G058900 [Ceratopteris richardii]|uniref:F-box domain-containing protein n=1 Tax=Ceratopteris richardii TaxID=49495 RepID=A0A8T2SVD4_CERRI|nr:hypothetical protein KP509_17G058900 [Ceratopteris richardii]